ncbi:MAG: Secreted repeat-containing protein [Rhodospirillales bacterium]|nr:Secreted repeat-containing protein [Rhodospirillales bacterium]
MRLVPIVVGVLGVALVAGGLYRFAGHGGQQGMVLALAEPAPFATPPGVTYETARTGGTVLLATAGIQIPAMAAAYADAKGMTLYTYDKDDQPGKSACTSDCATLWPALAAPATATAFGDWTVVTRDDASKQWALKGKPLYTYSKDKTPGDGGGNGLDGVWHIALFKAGEGYKMPDGVALLDSSNASAQVLANEQGMPLYTFDGDPNGGKPTCVSQPCTDHWTPYVAAQLAKPIPNFTVVDRGDGVFQWAFKGKPLYTYDGDVEPGDANGNGLDGKWHTAAVFRNFMPQGIIVERNRFGASTLATSDGRVLYVRDRVVGTNTGHNLRTGSRGNPMVGKILGTKSCDAECAKTWIPLAAPGDAQPSGYWDVATRDDGTKQWVYRGFAVYSYSGDKKPGDMLGNDTYDIMAGNDPFIMADLGVKGMGAFFWHTATP